jgi:metallophosphoesterase superfamily enzyme
MMYNANMKKVDTEFKTLQNFIVDYKLTGAEKTTLLSDLHINYEVASQRKSNKERYHRDLLTRAVKTYGH